MAKPYILLDLDQTIISAEATEEFSVSSNEEKYNKFTYHELDDLYIIFERPHVQEFLDFVFENFNVIVWTAATKGYALFVIDKIILTKDKPNRVLDYIFFSYHCEKSLKMKNGSKDLSMLWEVLKIDGIKRENTFILDDNDEVYDTQPKNCVIAHPFFVTHDDSENDRFLLVMIDKLKELLQVYQKDQNICHVVRKINKKDKKKVKKRKEKK